MGAERGRPAGGERGVCEHREAVARPVGMVGQPRRVRGGSWLGQQRGQGTAVQVGSATGRKRPLHGQAGQLVPEADAAGPWSIPAVTHSSRWPGAAPAASASSGPVAHGARQDAPGARALAQRSPEVAIAEARSALLDFERLQALRHADAAGALLRSLGAPIRIGPKGIGALTRHEAEVLQLIGAGLSNAEIGDRLDISRKRPSTTWGTCCQSLACATGPRRPPTRPGRGSAAR